MNSTHARAATLTTAFIACLAAIAVVQATQPDADRPASGPGWGAAQATIGSDAPARATLTAVGGATDSAARR